MQHIHDIKIIGFDADDTLWVNEPYFRDAEERFCDLLEAYMPRHDIARELLRYEVENLHIYGYGIKSFMLSMVEAALSISAGTISSQTISKIIDIGKKQLDHPIEILDGVESVLSQLYPHYRLVMITKGDLLDQERKLKKSGLEKYFHHIEIVSEKREQDYQKLLSHVDVQPSEFCMIGNSLKSDILPVLKLGSYGIHVPYHTTWVLEQVDFEVQHKCFRAVSSIDQVLEYFPLFSKDIKI